jgi:uncharacterized protein (DUF1697 family)
MPRYAAFLRGINVAGRKATAAQLRSCFERMGFGDPTTFRASGNVIFEAPGASDAVAKKIEKALAKTLGYEVAAFVRDGREIRAIAAHRPFDDKLVERSKGKLQVVLLPDKPTARARKEMLALRSADDHLSFRGRELYWLPSGGLMESAIGMDGVARVLGPNTIRTNGTIELIAEKFFA